MGAPTAIATRKPTKVFPTLAKKLSTNAPLTTISHITARTSSGLGRTPGGR
jgi:hypothetical protein